MNSENIFLASPVFSWILMFWVLIPFLIRPFIRKRKFFRKSLSASEDNNAFALWNAYVIACWMLLPLLLLLIHPQVGLTIQLLYFLVISWWSRAIVELLQKANKLPAWKYLGVAHLGINLAVLLVGISFIQSQLSGYVVVSSSLEVVSSTDGPVIEAADWLGYCFLVCATLLTSLQLYIEFIKLNPTEDENRKSNLVKKLDLASLSVGFTHLCFQSSLLLFVNSQILF